LAVFSVYSPAARQERAPFFPESQMRLFLAVLVGTIAHLALSFAAGFAFTLLARATGTIFPVWFGMLVSQLEVAGAVAIAVLYAQRRPVART
jgi:hypothetical protein